MAAIRVLYISYDGIFESLGQSQVLSYLRHLGDRQVRFHLLTFEKDTQRGEDRDWRGLKEQLSRQGIEWTSLAYHKTPRLLATVYDVIAGVVHGARIARRQGAQILHARGFIPAVIAVVLKRLLGIGFLFDMRGFWADERVQGGLLAPNSSLYRLAKKLEKTFLKHADAVVSLTNAARQEIGALPYLEGRCPPIAVIPTCVDLDRFQIQNGARGALPDFDFGGKFVLIYSGSIGTWYRLDPMLEFFRVLKGQIHNAFFLVLTQTDLPEMEKSLSRYGISKQDVKVQNVPFPKVPDWLSRGDAGIILSHPCLANVARCPTKLAEFLACGVPVIVSVGIGDTEAIVQGERVGVVARELTGRGFEESVTALRELLKDGDLKGRCRRAAEKYFSLDAGSLEYEAVYQRLLGGGEAEVTV